MLLRTCAHVVKPRICSTRRSATRNPCRRSNPSNTCLAPLFTKNQSGVNPRYPSVRLETLPLQHSKWTASYDRYSRIFVRERTKISQISQYLVHVGFLHDTLSSRASSEYAKAHRMLINAPSCYPLPPPTRHARGYSSPCSSTSAGNSQHPCRSQARLDRPRWDSKQTAAVKTAVSEEAYRSIRSLKK